MESESDKRNHAHVYSNIENGITCRMEHLREKWLVVDDTNDEVTAHTGTMRRLVGIVVSQAVVVARAC